MSDFGLCHLPIIIGLIYSTSSFCGDPVFQVDHTWVKVFRINPEFRILRLTFHRKSASKY